MSSAATLPRSLCVSTRKSVGSHALPVPPVRPRTAAAKTTPPCTPNNQSVAPTRWAHSRNFWPGPDRSAGRSFVSSQHREPARGWRLPAGLRGTAVIWQPNRNQGGLCSFCAADRRPPEPKDRGHGNADKTDSRSHRGRAGAHRLWLREWASQRDAPRPCRGGCTAARSADGVVTL